MAQANGSGGSHNGQVVVGKQYDPYTGKWHDVYGPKPSSSTKSKSKTKPKSSSSKKPSSPPKPTSGTGRGSGTANKQVVDEGTREIEYDLEGTVEFRPLVHLASRDIITIEGLGSVFSGKFFLTTVTHTINRSGYTQEGEVLRNDFVWRTSPVKPSPPSKKKKKKPKTHKSSKKRYYTVKRGDTLWGISKRFYGKGSLYMKIVKANKGTIKNPHWIYPRQRFLIP